MSAFYGRPWYRLTEAPDPAGVAGLGPCMLEWRIDAQDAASLQSAARAGFELVETDVEFRTAITGPQEHGEGLAPYRPEHLPRLLEIVRECFIDNERFQNRFKNRHYFDEDRSTAYYLDSLTNFVGLDGAVATVAVDDGEVVGFYLLQRLEEELYRGVLTGVTAGARGRKLHILMQRHCYAQIGHDYTVINRTQLNNYRVINNHILEGRQLANAEHIFYRRIDG